MRRGAGPVRVARRPRPRPAGCRLSPRRAERRPHDRCRARRDAAASGVDEAAQLDRVETVDRRPAGCAVPGREQDRDGIVVETARREQHRARRTGIEPVQIVHDDEHRRRLRCGREQRERAGGDQVPIVGRHRRAPTDGGLERSSLRRRDAVEVVTQGSEQLQQTGVVEPSLGLDAAGAYPLEPGGRRLRASSSDVLPMPASPTITSAPAVPPRAASSTRVMRASCSCRPITSAANSPKLGVSPRRCRARRRDVHAMANASMTNASTTTTLRRALSGMLRIGAAASITNAWRLGMVVPRPPATLRQGRAV